MAELSYENSDRKMSDLELIKKTWKYIRPYRFKLLLAIFFMLLLVVFDLIGPLITAEILEALTIKKDIVTEAMIPIDIKHVIFFRQYIL